MSTSGTWRHYPLRLMLLTLIVGLLVATVTTIAAVAYFNLKISIRELFSSRFSEISQSTSEKVGGLLEPATAILQECTTQAKLGLLPADDSEALGRRLVERLRYENRLTWISYGNEAGQYSGAHRDKEGNILLNRSWVESPKGRLVEEYIYPDGRRRMFRADNAWSYDPRQREWYQLAAAADGPVWTKPYEFFDEEGMGITCAMPLRDGKKLRGVFTADFHLRSLSGFLSKLRIGKSGRAFVLARNGTLIAGPGSHDQAAHDPILQSALRNLPISVENLSVSEPASILFDENGMRYAAAFEAFPIAGNTQWVTAVIVPEDELLGSVTRNTIWTALIGLFSLVVAIVLGNVLWPARLARPLQQISEDLSRAGRMDLTSGPPPRSHITEIAVVGESAERMKASLRSFGHYVPTDLVRDLLSSGQDAALDATLRTVTIHFSDIQGFTRLSETTPPQELVQSLGRYFAVLDRALAEHGGTLDKFIGDGILAFFNAPRPLENHAAAACHSALLAQQELARMREQNDGSEARFHARIGLHTDEVLIGNFGTPNRFDYTVLGDGVNLANAIEKLNKVYGTQILVTQETYAAAGSDFEWRKIDRVSVKGRTRGGDVFELLGERRRVAEKILTARDHYERAMDAYATRRFAAAIGLFESALEYRPGDKAAMQMLVRCQTYLETPPPQEWNQLHVYTSV